MTVPSVDDRTYGFRGTIQFDFLPDRIFRTEKFLGRMLCQCYPLFRFQEIKAAGEYLYPEHMHEARVCIDFIQLPDSAIVYCHFHVHKKENRRHLPLPETAFLKKWIPDMELLL